MIAERTLFEQQIIVSMKRFTLLGVTRKMRKKFMVSDVRWSSSSMSSKVGTRFRLLLPFPSNDVLLLPSLLSLHCVFRSSSASSANPAGERPPFNSLSASFCRSNPTFTMTS